MRAGAASDPHGRDEDRLWVDLGRRDVLRVQGEVDVVVAQEFALELGVADWELGRTLARLGVREVDLTRATSIDSAMVAVLVAIAPHLRPGRLRVRGAGGSPLAVLQMTGVAPLFDLQPSDG